jgi:hypothetical protein
LSQLAFSTRLVVLKARNERLTQNVFSKVLSQFAFSTRLAVLKEKLTQNDFSKLFSQFVFSTRWAVLKVRNDKNYKKTFRKYCLNLLLAHAWLCLNEEFTQNHFSNVLSQFAFNTRLAVLKTKK